MLWLTVEDARPYDGRYPFDFLGEFTIREWGWIKRFADYYPLTIDNGIRNGDPELFAAFAVIAMQRAGRIEQREVATVFERFKDTNPDATFGLTNDTVDEEDDAGPPAPSSAGSTNDSGTSSNPPSATSPPTPSHSGTPDSDSSPWPLTVSQT